MDITHLSNDGILNELLFDIPSDSDCDDDLLENEFEIDNIADTEIISIAGRNIIEDDSNLQNVSRPSNSSNSVEEDTIIEDVNDQSNSKGHLGQPILPKRYCNVTWKVGNQNFKDHIFIGDTTIPDNIKGLDTPFQFFKYFIDDDLYDLIAEETLKYCLFKDINQPFHLSIGELKHYFGILIIMSVVKLNNIRQYWDPIIGNKLVMETMTVNQFEKIRKYLHFSDLSKMPDNTDPQFDRLYRIRPVIKYLNTKFSTVPLEEHLSVDEQICATKAKHFLKTYNPMKPHKWGFKNFVLCGASGYAYQFELYSGKVIDKSEPDLGASANIVKRLSTHIPDKKNYKLFCDNYYTSIGLLVYLQTRDIYCVGTIRKNRFANLKLPIEKEFKKLGRGSCSENYSSIDGTDVSVVSWYDNKVVTLSSTYVGEHPHDQTERFDRTNKKRISVNRPAIVREYNKFMGGVDLMDMLMSLHKISMRTKKWYFRIFYHLIDMSVVNSWLLFRRVTNNNNMTLTKFRLEIAYTLCKIGTTTEKAKRGRPSSDNLEQMLSKKKRGPQHPIPTSDVRKDGVDHWPVFIDNRIRCKHPDCNRQTFIICEKCKVGLCLNKTQNCFKEYHTR